MSQLFLDVEDELNKFFEEIIDNGLDEDKEIEWPENFLVFSNVDECDPIELIESAMKLSLRAGLANIYRLYAGETHGYAVAVSHKHLRETLKDMLKDQRS